VGVFVCRLDASGTDRPNKIVTMAGYVGFLPEWNDFEIKAREVCARENVSVLHAKEFCDTKGDFAGWSRYKKESFVREIHDLSLGRLELGISFSVEKSAFLKGKREHKVAHNESAFGFCFRSIAYGLMHDVVVSEVLKKGENLTFILESGDQNGEDAHRIFNWLKRLNSTFDRALYSFGFADKRSSVGLQWADFLAVTTRRYADAYKTARQISRRTKDYFDFTRSDLYDRSCGRVVRPCTEARERRLKARSNAFRPWSDSSASTSRAMSAKTSLDRLAENGRLILPLTAAEFPAGDVRHGAVSHRALG
jgi:hypothetical protein